MIGDLVEEGSDLLKYKSLLKKEKNKKNFIASLKIPTFFKFTKYNFLDVLQALTRHVFSVEYTASKIAERKAMIKQTNDTTNDV